MKCEYIETGDKLREVIQTSLQNTKIIDMHTHLFPPEYKELCLCGIDEILTYHYLIAEALCQVDISAGDFWSMDKKEQANLIWRALFIENSPLSEATQGVITILDALGIDYAGRNLDYMRQQFNSLIDQGNYIERIMNLANVDKLVMTNDPFNPKERKHMNYASSGGRFLHSLRLDALISDWDNVVEQLNELGYKVDSVLNEWSIKEVSRFLRDWITRLNPMYLAISLPPTFRFPEDPHAAKMLGRIILPVCTKNDLPLAVMLGALKNVNPNLKLAGDAVGIASVESLGNLCTVFPDNKFLVTMLSRENQHELTVIARKFNNMMIFGCWWYLNTAYFIDELTRIRMELLGTNFIPQHSDCCVLEQLIYKWQHSFIVIENILFEKYTSLTQKGWKISAREIERDIDKLFRKNFLAFFAKKSGVN